jgi:hypothetical protein
MMSANKTAEEIFEELEFAKDMGLGPVEHLRAEISNAVAAAILGRDREWVKQVANANDSGSWVTTKLRDPKFCAGYLKERAALEKELVLNQVVDIARDLANAAARHKEATPPAHHSFHQGAESAARSIVDFIRTSFPEVRFASHPGDDPQEARDINEVMADLSTPTVAHSENPDGKATFITPTVENDETVIMPAGVKYRSTEYRIVCSPPPADGVAPPLEFPRDLPLERLKEEEKS